MEVVAGALPAEVAVNVPKRPLRSRVSYQDHGKGYLRWAWMLH